MPTKRTLLVTAVIAVLVAVSGCSALQGGSDVDTDRILNDTQQSMQDVETFTFDAQMSMSSQQSGRPVNMSATGAVNVTAGEGRVEITARGRTIPIYFVNDTMYMKQSDVWVKQSLSNASAMTQGQFTPQGQTTPGQQLMNATSVSFEGNTTIDGQDVYELSVDVDEAKIKDALQQQSQNVSSMVSYEEMTYTVYITHDENYLKRLSGNVTMSMMGQPMNTDVQITLSDFNENVSIDLPAAAQNAKPMGATG